MRALKKRVFTDDEAGSRLAAKGYSDADVDVLLAVA